MPIYAASITPIGLKVAGEVADGVLPIFMSPEKAGLVTKPLREGIARGRPGRTLADFDVAPFVRVSMGPDLQACRDALKPELALYIGGMGARAKNFYNDFAKQMGYEAAAAKIQDAFLGGRRAEAIAAVPDALVDETSLVGSPSASRTACRPGRKPASRHEVGSMLLSGVTRRVAARRRRSRALTFFAGSAPLQWRVILGPRASGPPHDHEKTRHWSGALPARSRLKRPSATRVAWPWGGIPFLPPKPAGTAPASPALRMPSPSKEDDMPLFFLIAIGAGALTLGATAIDPAADVRHQNRAGPAGPDDRLPGHQLWDL